MSGSSWIPGGLLSVVAAAGAGLARSATAASPGSTELLRQQHADHPVPGLASPTSMASPTKPTSSGNAES
jgi:hypothetical protein